MTTASTNNQDFTVTNGTINTLLIKIHLVIQKHYQLFTISTKENPLTQTWDKWVNKKLLTSKTVRGIATIIYGSYDRKVHNVKSIIDTLSMTIPFLGDYYEFKEKEDYGDIIAVLKTLTFFELQEVTINEIYTSSEIPKIVNMINEEISEMRAEYENEPAWLKTWIAYTEKGITQCNTKDELAQIILPQATDYYFSTIIEKLQSALPALSSRFQIEPYNDELIIMKYRQKEQWEEITQTTPHATAHIFSTPATSQPSITANPFSVLAIENEDIVDEPNEENVSQQLSHQFSASSNLTPETNKSNVTSEEGTLTIERYNEIIDLIKEGKQDEVSLSDFEKYIHMNFSKAKEEFEAEIKIQQTEATKSISHHKNSIKQELDKKVKKFESSAREVQQKVDKLEKAMKTEEARCITSIASVGNETILKISGSTNKALQVQKELHDTTKYATQITSAAQTTKKSIDDSITIGYNSFFTDVQETVTDCKDELTDWIERRLNKIYARETDLVDLITDQKNTIRNQQLIITDLSQRVNALESKPTIPPMEQSKRHDPPETPPPIPSPMPSQFTSQPPPFPTVEQSLFSPPRMTRQKPTTANPTLPTPRFKNGDRIQYNKALLYFTGTIIEAIWKQNRYVYTLSMDSRTNSSPTVYYNCHEDGISLIESAQHHDINDSPSLHDDDSAELEILEEPQWHNNSNMGDNEYKLHDAATVKRINSHQILKHAKDWPIQIVTKDDLQRVYARWRYNFGYYNIPLKVWTHISAESSLLDLSPTCINYKAATTTMSAVIFDYFEANKEKLFEVYTEPKYILKAFENQADGLGFMQQLLTIAHPKLRDVTDYKKMPKPKFNACHDIHDFIATYLAWLREEIMLNNRKYTDKENIDYILSELDSRFDTIRLKVERRMTEVYADPSQPLPFPPQYMTNEKLSLNLMKLLPQSERDITDFSNNLPTINKMMTRSATKSYNKYNKPITRTPKDNFENIKWEFMPGAVCSACGQNNHEIYKTGCPAMAIFCNCKKFYDKTDPKKLAPVLEQFATFKAEQRKKQKARKKDLRATIKRLKDCGAEDAKVNKVFLDQYLEEFPSEMYAHEPLSNEDSNDE